MREQVYIEISPALQSTAPEYLPLLEEKKRRRIRQIKRVYQNHRLSFHDKNRTFQSRDGERDSGEFNSTGPVKLRKPPSRAKKETIDKSFHFYRGRNDKLSKLLEQAGWEEFSRGGARLLLSEGYFTELMLGKKGQVHNHIKGMEYLLSEARRTLAVYTYYRGEAMTGLPPVLVVEQSNTRLLERRVQLEHAMNVVVQHYKMYGGRQEGKFAGVFKSIIEQQDFTCAEGQLYHTNVPLLFTAITLVAARL